MKEEEEEEEEGRHTHTHICQSEETKSLENILEKVRERERGREGERERGREGEREREGGESVVRELTKYGLYELSDTFTSCST